ncbi:putative RNA-binding protein EEED8.10 [Aphomia sociella]
MSLFDGEEQRYLNPEILQVLRREVYGIGDIEVLPYGFRNIPTHTEDGIPIRKLYVTNLPPKTTRAELFSVFAPYGFIKSCWLRIGEKGPQRVPMPTYAFVTFTNPEDAHKALEAPSHEKILRGRNLRTYPADSWHQPVEDADGKIHWKPRDYRSEMDAETPDQEACPESTQVINIDNATNSEINATASEQEISKNEQEMPEPEIEDCYNILDILNSDCLNHIMSYVPIRDLIRSERVSKQWQDMVQEYLQSIRTFKTSWWQHGPVTLTTAVLRRVLARLTLSRLHVDHPWSALNDRTAHAIGKFCPNLEELKIVGMHTKNWNPLIYGCKQLKGLSFVSCNKITDSSLVHLVKEYSSIESLTVANNTHVTGLFLTGSNPLKLTALAFYNCYSLQGTLLNAAFVSLPNLTSLKLDACPVTLWRKVPLILKKVPQLQELSLCEYSSVDVCLNQQNNDDFCEALANLNQLKTLNISKNIYITNDVLKQIAQSCPKLESLDVSSCNSRKSFPYPGVGDEGVMAVCSSCALISRLDVSYLARISDTGLAAATRLPRLRVLQTRGNSGITASSLMQALAACHHLEDIDACGCENVSELVVEAAVKALETKPRKLMLRMGGTAVPEYENEFPVHELLTLNTEEDRCNPHFRPDFVDRILEDSSDDDSLIDELLENDDFDDFIGQDELFLDDDDDNDDGERYFYGFHYY